MNDLEAVAQRVVKTLTDVVESLAYEEPPTDSQILHAAALTAAVSELFTATDAAALQAASERAQALAVVPL